jgi:integrase
MHGDGDGLYMQITRAGVRSWILRFQLDGRRRHMGLGPFPDVSLAEARQRARSAHQTLARGEDPITARQQASALSASRRAAAMTFGEASLAFVAAQESGWRNAKHRQQWASTLATYAGPVLGEMDVGMVDTAHVLRVLEPIWRRKHETASRLRGRIERVLDWAKVRGLRSGENPARWRGHLQHMLPAVSKTARVVHHPALPYAEAPKFAKTLRKQDGLAARALELAILTATRTGEVLGARWDEIDLEAKVWTIPSARTKTRREHRVPLSEPALRLLRELPRIDEHVFPGWKRGRPLSNMAMLLLLRRMDRTDITPHGFRSTFRDWCAESGHDHQLAEMALGHVVGSAVERAYRRSDLFALRARLMADWAKFCDGN